MLNQFARTELIFGTEGMEKLKKACVAVFGLGGVGGYTVEALARSGVGRLDLFDNDQICVTNLNRQLIATHNNIGWYKVDAAKERIQTINPEATVNTHCLFYTPETASAVDLSGYDYIVDAIDTVAGKIELAVRADACGVPLISSMGAGNKVDATAFRVADIYHTSVCPLAKVMRHELRKRGIEKLKVVYSQEPPITPLIAQPIASTVTPPPEEKCTARRQIPGSNAFVPPVVGLIIAGEVIKDITAYRKG